MSLLDDQKRQQDERLALQDKMKAFHSEHEDKWTDEVDVQWKDMSKTYDDNFDELKSTNKQIQDHTNRVQQLEKQSDDFARLEKDNPRAARSLLGRDGAKLGDRLEGEGEKFVSGSVDRRIADSMLAFDGWLNRDKKNFTLTQEHVDAAGRVNFNLNTLAIDIPLRKDFSEVRDALNPVRHGFNPGQNSKAAFKTSYRNALSTQTGSAGGFLFGDSFMATLEAAQLAFGGMLQVADVMRTPTGENFSWPTVDDTGNTGKQVGENPSSVTETDITLGQVIWSSYDFTSDLIRVPNSLARDSAFDVPGMLAPILGERLGRILNTKFTTGNGAGTPKGIVPAATAGVTSASSAALVFDELIDLEHTLDPSRRIGPGVGYMFHDSILQILRKLKTGDGDYLWQAGANSGAPDTLNTYPYTINQDMASTLATANISVLFGVFPMYKIRQVASIRFRRLVERYGELDQEGFVAFTSGDGNLLEPGDGVVRKLTQV